MPNTCPIRHVFIDKPTRLLRLTEAAVCEVPIVGALVTVHMHAYKYTVHHSWALCFGATLALYESHIGIWILYELNVVCWQRLMYVWHFVWAYIYRYMFMRLIIYVAPISICTWIFVIRCFTQRPFPGIFVSFHTPSETPSRLSSSDAQHNDGCRCCGCNRHGNNRCPEERLFSEEFLSSSTWWRNDGHKGRRVTHFRMIGRVEMDSKVFYE